MNTTLQFLENLREIVGQSAPYALVVNTALWAAAHTYFPEIIGEKS